MFAALEEINTPPTHRPTPFAAPIAARQSVRQLIVSDNVADSFLYSPTAEAYHADEESGDEESYEQSFVDETVGTADTTLGYDNETSDEETLYHRFFTVRRVLFGDSENDSIIEFEDGYESATHMSDIINANQRDNEIISSDGIFVDDESDNHDLAIENAAAVLVEFA